MYRLQGRPAVHAARQGGKQAAMACMDAMSGRTCAAMGLVYCPKVFWGTVAGSDVRPGIPPGCKFIWRKHHEVFRMASLVCLLCLFPLSVPVQAADSLKISSTIGPVDAGILPLLADTFSKRPVSPSAWKKPGPARP